MRSRGKVAAINPRRGMVAIATDDGGFTIIELLSDWSLEVGDDITWTDRYGLGHEMYRNVTQQTEEEVFVQNHDVSRSNLQAQLLL